MALVRSLHCFALLKPDSSASGLYNFGWFSTRSPLTCTSKFRTSNKIKQGAANLSFSHSNNWKVTTLLSSHGQISTLQRCTKQLTSASVEQEVAKLPTVTSQSLETLENEFKCASVSFGSVGGVLFAKLSTSNGSSARILIEGARVVSYKARMWHQGIEELLYSAINKKVEDGDGLVRGGIVFSFPEFGELIAGEASTVLGRDLARVPWQVTAASDQEDGKSTQVAFQIDSGSAEVPLTPFPCTIKYTVTLRSSSLTTHVEVLNSGSEKLSFTASICAHLSISSRRGAELDGLKGYEYFRGATEPIVPNIIQTSFLSGLMATFGLGDPRYPELDSKEKPKVNIGALVDGGNGAASLMWARDDSSGKTAMPEMTSADGCMIESGASQISSPNWSSLNMHKKGYSSSGMDDQSSTPMAAIRNRIYLKAPLIVAMMDKGLRRSIDIQSGPELPDIIIDNPGNDCGLPEYETFACIGRAQAAQHLILNPGRKWGASITIHNPGAE